MKNLEIITVILLLLLIISSWSSYRQETININLQSIIENWITVYTK